MSKEEALYIPSLDPTADEALREFKSLTLRMRYTMPR